jgi:hypothetical protein
MTLSYAEVDGKHSIRNEDAVTFIRERRPFRNQSYTFYGFTDVNNVYGVFSCGRLVAKVYPDGHYEKVKKFPSWSHAQVIEKVLP